MLGLRNPKDFTRQEGAAVPGQGAPWAGANWQDADARVWHELKLQELVQDQDFLQVGL